MRLRLTTDAVIRLHNAIHDLDVEFDNRDGHLHSLSPEKRGEASRWQAIMTPSMHGHRFESELRPRSRRKAWLWWGLVTGVPLVLLVLVTAAAWIISGFQASQKLAVQVAKVRARGEPLTTIELSDYYKPAADRPNITANFAAALALCEARELKTLEKDLPIVGMAPEPPPPPQSWPQLPEAEAYLARLAPALEALHDIARRDGTSRFPVDFNSGIAMTLPPVAAWRQGTKVLSLQFHVELHRGRSSDATNCILAQIGMARSIDQEPLLIPQLVRLLIVGLAIGNVQTAVRQVQIDDTDLARLQEGLRKIDYVPCLKRALAGERAFAYMASIKARAAPDARDLAFKPGEAQDLAEQPPWRVRDAAKILEMSLRIAEAADESLLAAWNASQQVEAAVVELAQRVVDKRLYALTLLIRTPYEPAVYAFLRSTARRACADAALAAKRYRQCHGHWPDSLEELIPEYLPAVPVDPFSGRPVEMLVTAQELTVYSVGRDGEDNQGTLSIREEPHTDLGFVIPLHPGETPQNSP
jgi:hypothetical protein